MLLKDPAKLTKLMAERGVGLRELSRAAGWRSATNLHRMIHDPTRRTCTTERAHKIAAYLGVAPESLFLPRSNGKTAQSDRSGSAA